MLARYVLDDRVGSDEGAEVWRGTDARLRRAVSVLLLPLEDPRAGAVRDQACRASTFSDRRAVSVLDVGDDGPAQRLVVVSEWAPAVGFGDYLASRGGEPLPAAEALDIALELARVLTAAHTRGLAHGHLRPNSLAVTDSGEVRLRGLGTAGALAHRPDDLPADAVDGPTRDVEGVGWVLYAGLTGRWPGGRVDHLAAAERLPGGALPWPSRVVPEVPAILDEIVARAVPTCALPRGRTRFADLAALTAALTAAADAAPPPLPPRRRVQVPWARLVGILAAVAGVVAAGVVGINLATGPLTKPGPATPRNTGSIGLGLTSPGNAAPTPSVPPPGTTLPIVSVTAIGPSAGAADNPSQAGLSIDGNPATAWTTNTYSSAGLGGKSGVGLLLDLGAPRPFTTVKLILVGNGTSLSVLAGPSAAGAPQGFHKVEAVRGAPNELTMRTPRAVTARFVIIWLTRLPPSNQQFQGGIAEVTISS
jgi:hypothetical protein